MIRQANAKYINRFVRQASASTTIPIPTKPVYRDLDPETRKIYDRMIRVDHAGERGADTIYNGQWDVLKDTESGDLIKHMWEQEKIHLATFEQLLTMYRVRPTVFLPLWDILGYSLGYATATMGKESAMACTVAVEESITEHYNDQIRELLIRDPELHAEMISILTKFRDEEQEHHDIGLAEGAENAPAFQAMKFIIKSGCQVAIAISEKY